MGIKIKIGVVFVLFVGVLSGYCYTLPEFIEVETGLFYDRQIGQRRTCISYVNSHVGMNEFSGRNVRGNRLLSSTFRVINFIRFEFAPKERMLKEISKSCPQTGNLSEFDPPQPEHVMINGLILDDLKVKVFPFKVKNRASETSLECTLVKFYKDDRFVFAFYCNENNGEVGVSFCDVSGRAELVGDESDCPYLTKEEAAIQVRFGDYAFRILHPDIIKSWEEMNRINRESMKLTNDVEVMVNDL